MKQGYVHLYYGTGAGKTTASVGLCARAAGAGLRVLFAQFLKGRPTAESASLEALGVRVLRPDISQKFWFAQSDAERLDSAARLQETFAAAVAAAEECDLLVLDEAADAESLGALLPGSLAAFLQDRPAGCEVVITGHTAEGELFVLADYVTRFEAEKHPYDRGVLAREGIEF